MREILVKLVPDRFEDLIAILALYRPGPLQSGMVETYIDRKHGREDVSYLHPDLEPILSETYGVILYQEQVMRIANVLAGFSIPDLRLGFSLVANLPTLSEYDSEGNKGGNAEYSWKVEKGEK